MRKRRREFVGCVCIATGVTVAPSARAGVVRAEEVAKQARAQDVVLVFFAGHGVAVRNGGGYYYFSQDARNAEITGSPFKDWFISSDENPNLLFFNYQIKVTAKNENLLWSRF